MIDAVLNTQQVGDIVCCVLLKLCVLICVAKAF